MNSPDIWVRSDQAFTPIIEADYFEAAQRIFAKRARRFSNDEMLRMLSELLAQRGGLSGLIIDELEDMPSTATYRHRFGSLVVRIRCGPQARGISLGYEAIEYG